MGLAIISSFVSSLPLKGLPSGFFIQLPSALVCCSIALYSCIKALFSGISLFQLPQLISDLKTEGLLAPRASTPTLSNIGVKDFPAYLFKALLPKPFTVFASTIPARGFTKLLINCALDTSLVQNDLPKGLILPDPIALPISIGLTTAIVAAK